MWFASCYTCGNVVRLPALMAVISTAVVDVSPKVVQYYNILGQRAQELIYS